MKQKFIKTKSLDGKTQFTWHWDRSVPFQQALREQVRKHFRKGLKAVYILAALVLIGGCASKPSKPCNVERIALGHPDMNQALEDHKELIMDFMHTIAVLEQEAGGYQ
jgi:hypothetical protein